MSDHVDPVLVHAPDSAQILPRFCPDSALYSALDSALYDLCFHIVPPVMCRKVQKETAGGQESERVRLKLEIEVEVREYHHA